MVQRECANNRVLAQARAEFAELEAARQRDSAMNAEAAKWRFQSAQASNPSRSVDSRPEHVLLSPGRDSDDISSLGGDSPFGG